MENFKILTTSIEVVHTQLQSQACKSVNNLLTIRNWIIGNYIVEFEQNGQNRAKYGSNLLSDLARSLKIKGLTAPELSRCRQFYNCYPTILGSVSQELRLLIPQNIFGSVIQKLTQESNEVGKSGSVSVDLLIERLSFSHFVELIKIGDILKRTFYELECIKGIWSVRELKRQIGSLYYERSGLSNKPEKLSELTQKHIIPSKSTDIIKNIYAFDFLDLKVKDVVEESDLETALINHLQEFIIELGHGFCFETRQKRILIGENYYFIDLLFYHRILKCHVLIELKLGAFTHGDIGQLNTYLNYFKEEISEKNDNPPVGILMVAEKDHALVKFATAGMDENLFVQQYLLQLPSIEQLEKYIESELKELK